MTNAVEPVAVTDLSVRAIDVGYGNVKFTLRHVDMDKPIECSIYPSRSPMATGKSLTAELLRARDTVVVKVGEHEYEVGKQVNYAMGDNDESAVLERDFCLTDAYLARLLGALYYMRCNDPQGVPYTPVSTIELLVVGLPVSTYKSKDLVKSLTKRLTGYHELPNERSVEVKRVVALAQPLGAFYEYATQNKLLDMMKSQNTLIIDPGFFTFDWLLMGENFIANDRMSHSVNRGVSAILECMADEINKQEGKNVRESKLVRLLEDHYRTGNPFILFNKEIDLSKYEEKGIAVVANEAVSQMVKLIGDGSDIHNIILAGGGAKFYQNAIQAKYPYHEVLIMKEPVFSNVRGFQIAGEQIAMGKRIKERSKSKTTA